MPTGFDKGKRLPTKGGDNVIPFNKSAAPNTEQDDDRPTASGGRGPRRPDDAKDIACIERRRDAIVQIGHGLKTSDWDVDSPAEINAYRWEAQQNRDFCGAKMGKNKVHPLAKTAYFHSNIDSKEHFSNEVSPAAARNEREYQLRMQLGRQKQYTPAPRPSGG